MQHPTIYRPFKYGSAVIQPTVTTYTVGAATKVVRLLPSVDCWIIIAHAVAAPTAGSGNSLPMLALGGKEFFLVAPNDVISIICNDGISTGFMSIVEMTR